MVSAVLQPFAHQFNYQAMKNLNGKQMRDLWEIAERPHPDGKPIIWAVHTPGPAEIHHGRLRHPPHALVLDPSAVRAQLAWPRYAATDTSSESTPGPWPARPPDTRMKVMRATAHVRDGRLVIDEPTDLPEGSEVEVELEIVDGDDLDDVDRAALHAALAESEDDVAAGRVRPAAEVLAELHRQR